MVTAVVLAEDMSTDPTGGNVIASLCPGRVLDANVTPERHGGREFGDGGSPLQMCRERATCTGESGEPRYSLLGGFMPSDRMNDQPTRPLVLVPRR